MGGLCVPAPTRGQMVFTGFQLALLSRTAFVA